MQPRIAPLRRLSLAAALLATAAGVAEITVRLRATGAVDWPHLARVLSYPLAPLVIFGLLARQAKHPPAA